MNAASLLNQLVKQKSPPKAKEKAPARPVKVFLGDNAEALTAWVAAAVAGDVMVARKDVEAATLNVSLLSEFAQQLYQQGFLPVNPKVRVELDGKTDHEANFTVQAKFKLMAKTSDELLMSLNKVLGESGAKLFANEIDTTPLTMLRPFNELVLGHYEGKDFVAATDAEQAAAVKLLNFVQGSWLVGFTDAERDLVLIHQDQMKVKPGFFNRVGQYCQSVEQLRDLFKVVVPVHFLSHAKFGVSDTPAERHQRLTSAVSAILGDGGDPLV